MEDTYGFYFHIVYQTHIKFANLWRR